MVDSVRVELTSSNLGEYAARGRSEARTRYVSTPSLRCRWCPSLPDDLSSYFEPVGARNDMHGRLGMWSIRPCSLPLLWRYWLRVARPQSQAERLEKRGRPFLTRRKAGLPGAPTMRRRRKAGPADIRWRRRRLPPSDHREQKATFDRIVADYHRPRRQGVLNPADCSSLSVHSRNLRTKRLRCLRPATTRRPSTWNAVGRTMLLPFGTRWQVGQALRAGLANLGYLTWQRATRRARNRTSIVGAGRSSHRIDFARNQSGSDPA